MKRHGYYCRSRRAGSTTRSRSCISCARGKARCDNRRPECSRCLSKAIKCYYPTKAPRGTGPRNQYGDDTPTQQRRLLPSLVADHPSVEIRQEAGNDDDAYRGTALDISDLDFAGLGGERFDPDVDFVDFLNLQTNDEGVQYHSSDSSSLAPHSMPSTYQTNQIQRANGSPKPSIQTISTYVLRSFDQRPNLKTGAQRIANLILHTLKSYPLMMLRDGTLPPFIHPHLISSAAENNNMEPLTNCISLVHMLSSRTHGSRKLFWKNVRMECERLCAEVP